FINYVIDSPSLRYIGATNEGDAVAIASGAELGGKRSVVMFQNSGFGNTVNPLTSLNAMFEIPVLVMATLRGEPGGPADEPQHGLKARDLIVAPTGDTGRECYALDDRPNRLDMVGSVGCAWSFGLGLAWARPDKRVIVLDGDGAALMRLGALATLGYERPKNL